MANIIRMIFTCCHAVQLVDRYDFKFDKSCSGGSDDPGLGIVPRTDCTHLVRLVSVRKMPLFVC